MPSPFHKTAKLNLTSKSMLWSSWLPILQLLGYVSTLGNSSQADAKPVTQSFCAGAPSPTAKSLPAGKPAPGCLYDAILRHLGNQMPWQGPAFQFCWARISSNKQPCQKIPSPFKPKVNTSFITVGLFITWYLNRNQKKTRVTENKVWLPWTQFLPMGPQFMDL